MRILYQDDHFLALEKPAGLLVHSSALAAEGDTVTTRLREAFAADERGIPRPAHRIDRPTSGILLAAFSGEALAGLNRAFREGEIHKTYLAVVRGWPGEIGEKRSIDLPLKKKNTKGGRRSPLRQEEPPLQEARTVITLLERLELPFPDRRHPATRLSLVQADPRTGRFHQIRRHLARIGYPIAGDTAHGDTSFNRCLARGFGVERIPLTLHAWRIRLNHPVTGEALTLEAPLPEETEKKEQPLPWRLFGALQKTPPSPQ